MFNFDLHAQTDLVNVFYSMYLQYFPAMIDLLVTTYL